MNDYEKTIKKVEMLPLWAMFAKSFREFKKKGKLPNDTSSYYPEGDFRFYPVCPSYEFQKRMDLRRQLRAGI